MRSFYYLNPWVKDTVLNVADGHSYSLLLPPKGAIIYGMSDFRGAFSMPAPADSTGQDTTRSAAATH
jgi:hypothetical protein